MQLKTKLKIALCALLAFWAYCWYTDQKEGKEAAEFMAKKYETETGKPYIRLENLK
jgi:hypothetical protein